MTVKTQRICRVCGCTECNCSQCLDAQGYPCHWVTEDLCSRCAEDKRNLGIYGKFSVARTDRRDALGEKHYGCEYFVLDLTHDPFAKPAIEAYAEACREEYPVLSKDLIEKAKQDTCGAETQRVRHESD